MKFSDSETQWIIRTTHRPPGASGTTRDWVVRVPIGSQLSGTCVLQHIVWFLKDILNLIGFEWRSRSRISYFILCWIRTFHCGQLNSFFNFLSFFSFRAGKMPFEKLKINRSWLQSTRTVLTQLSVLTISCLIIRNNPPRFFFVIWSHEIIFRISGNFFNIWCFQFDRDSDINFDILILFWEILFEKP